MNQEKRTWYKNGALKSVWIYKGGQMHGPQKGWFNNGTLSYEIHYKNGRLHGIYKSWYSDGIQMARNRFYEEGVLTWVAPDYSESWNTQE